MSAPVERFIRQILNKHARDGLEAITEKSNQVHSDVVAITIVLPELGTDEHPVYEYGFACRDTTGNKGSIRCRNVHNTDAASLQVYIEFLQRFVDTLKNEQSVAELIIQSAQQPPNT